MSDITTPAAPTPKPKRTRGDINLKYLTEYELSDRLVIKARKPERTAALTERGWPPARIDAYETLGNRLETAALAAVGRVSARKLDLMQTSYFRSPCRYTLMLQVGTDGKRQFKASAWIKRW
ncbi:MAG TPA: hypothetical protein VF585_04755 [Chthoniobacterales bacterium]|jgi:hypothetical protein